MPLPPAILETVLIRLAALFLIGANGDPIAARHAATQMLAAYDPKTTNELRIAANIIAFSFQALEALSQATTPDMSLPRVLRLRSGAVSLSRESTKAERRLGQLQKAGQQPDQSQHTQSQHAQSQHVESQRAETQPEPVEPAANIEKAIALIQDTADISQAAKASNLTWTQAYEQRQRDARIAVSLQKAEARIAAKAKTPPQARPHEHGQSA